MTAQYYLKPLQFSLESRDISGIPDNCPTLLIYHPQQSVLQVKPYKSEYYSHRAKKDFQCFVDSLTEVLVGIDKKTYA